MKKTVGRVVRILLVCSLLLFVSYRIYLSRGSRRAISGLTEPVQTEAEGSVKTRVNGYDVTITYLYEYEMDGLVVHTKRYNGPGVADKLAPVDVAVCWGDVARYNRQINFHWTQSNRFCNWYVSDVNDLDYIGGEEGMITQCSNNHLIPASSKLEKQIKRIHPGDHILIKGYLVNVDAEKPDGQTFWWYSSTTREDSGDGACEVIYVTSVEKLD